MSNENILIVEDEEKISRIVKSYLAQEGFVVSVAPTGQKAMELLSKGYDLIILDLMLPDIQGETLCTTIRQASDVPIIMLTAKGTEDERVRGLGLGADDYVVKPFSPRELVARVKAHLRRSQKDENQVLSFNQGNLKINIPSMEINIAEQVVALTKTEFNILLYLAKRPQVVISRTQMIHKILPHPPAFAYRDIPPGYARGALRDGNAYSLLSPAAFFKSFHLYLLADHWERRKPLL